MVVRECLVLGFPSLVREGTRCPSVSGGNKVPFVQPGALLRSSALARRLFSSSFALACSLCPDVCSGERCREMEGEGKVSQNHRMVGLEGTSVGHPVPPPAEAGSPTAGCTGPCPGGS